MTLAMPYPPWLTELMSASAETLALALLRGDPHSWRLDNATQLAAARDSLTDGRRTAEVLRGRFSGLTPRQIAHELGVAVEASDDDPIVGSLWRFADYRQRPPRIVLFSRGLAPLNRVLVGDVAERMLGRATLQDIFVSHELFHHAEAIRADPPIAQHYRPTLLRIGRWHWRTGIAALAEIAAGAFAQTLLELPCHPRVLDLVALNAIPPYAALTRSPATFP